MIQIAVMKTVVVEMVAIAMVLMSMLLYQNQMGLEMVLIIEMV